MKKFLFTFTLCLIAIIAGVTNLFILNEPSPVLAWGGISFTLISGSISAHHKIRENKQKAAAEREREHEAAIAETARLEEGLELLQGKDWAAEVTIDKINKELGLERSPAALAAEAEYTIIAGGVYADDIQPPADGEIEISGDAVEVRSGDGQLIAEFTEPGEEKELQDALTVIHKFKAGEASIIELSHRLAENKALIDNLNKRMQQARETPW